MRARKNFAKTSCNKYTIPLEYTSFAIRVIDLFGSTNCVYIRSLAMKSPTNERQFTNRKKFFMDRISLLRPVRSVRIDKSHMTSLAMKVF